MIMAGYYILEDQTVIPCDDIEKWIAFIEGGKCVIATEFICEHVQVSTVFLAIDHNVYTIQSILTRAPKQAPILFETKVFNGEHDGFTQRYRTYGGALAGHRKICTLLKSGGDLKAW